MNTKQYAIRKKGDGEFVLTYKEELGLNGHGSVYEVYTLDSFPHNGHDEWLCDHSGTVIAVLNSASQDELGSVFNPKHNLNPDDYEVVCIERKITVCQ